MNVPDILLEQKLWQQQKYWQAQLFTLIHGLNCPSDWYCLKVARVVNLKLFLRTNFFVIS